MYMYILAQGIVSVDQEKMEVTVRAGTTLSELNVLLEEHGLAMRILGSISEQTVAGAISTGKDAACHLYVTITTVLCSLYVCTHVPA